MEITIDIDEQVPLFAQLVAQIKDAVLRGDMGPGDALPSIRQLSNDLRINKKTVAKAYQLLERDSVIQTKGYRGTFIHPEARANSEVDLSTWVEAEVTKTVAMLRKSRVTDSEIRIAFAKAMSDRSQQGNQA